jgi:aminomethyltransferase
MRETPLHDAHLRLGARMVDFGGWSMPVSYGSGIIDEHRATRTSVGVFDVCHMGEVHFRGPRAAEALQRVITNDLGKLTDGRALYTVACLETGGIVDDLIIYRLSDAHYLVVVNATTREKDVAWFIEHGRGDCDIVDASDETGLIAFQGPAAQRALQTLTAASLGALPRFSILNAEVAGLRVAIARTGYTGEDGFEIFCDARDARALWDRLVEAAATVGGKPVGLGARDTLRLEARLPLYGQDLDETTTPLEAGLGWVVKLDGAPFVGRPALLAQKQAGVQRKLAGFVMVGRGVARHDYPIESPDGQPLGTTTSGGPAPTLGKNIGLGYVPTATDAAGTRIVVDCRGKPIDAEIVKGPFYKRPVPADSERGTA